MTEDHQHIIESVQMAGKQPVTCHSSPVTGNPIELRSEEIDAILGRVPGRLVRNGIAVITVIFLLLLIGSIFFSYPDTVTCRVVITSSHPPVHIISETPGRIGQLLVADKQEVKKDALLAVLDNPADTKEVLLLESLIDSLRHQKTFEDFDQQLLRQYFRLDDVTPAFLDFQKALREYDMFKVPKHYQQKITIQPEYQQSRQLMDNIIYTSGILQHHINLWKKKYTYNSPCEGVVSFVKVRMPGQMVAVGDLAMSILPLQQGTITGKIEIPVSGYGKIKPGQPINIKLDGYPFMEYGVIRGIITAIAPIPVNGIYYAEMKLPQGLQSNYGRNIPFATEMPGTADVIVQDLSLFQRFLQPVRSAINRK